MRDMRQDGLISRAVFEGNEDFLIHGIHSGSNGSFHLPTMIRKAAASDSGRLHEQIIARAGAGC